jgi:hypothetical protein
MIKENIPNWFSSILLGVVSLLGSAAYFDIKADLKETLKAGTSREIRIQVNEALTRQHESDIKEIKAFHQRVLDELKQINIQLKL